MSAIEFAITSRGWTTAETEKIFTEFNAALDSERARRKINIMWEKITKKIHKPDKRDIKLRGKNGKFLARLKHEMSGEEFTWYFFRELLLLLAFSIVHSQTLRRHRSFFSQRMKWNHMIFLKKMLFFSPSNNNKKYSTWQHQQILFRDDRTFCDLSKQQILSH